MNSVGSLIFYSVCCQSYLSLWHLLHDTDAYIFIDNSCIPWRYMFTKKNVWDNHFAPLLSVLSSVRFVIAILSLIGIKAWVKKRQQEEETNEYNIRWSCYATIKRILGLSYTLMIIILLSILTDNDILMMIVWYSCQVGNTISFVM
jgi:hypothetical protein